MMAKIYVRLQDWAEGESELVSENVEREKLCAEPEREKDRRLQYKINAKPFDGVVQWHSGTIR